MFFMARKVELELSLFFYENPSYISDSQKTKKEKEKQVAELFLQLNEKKEKKWHHEEPKFFMAKMTELFLQLNEKKEKKWHHEEPKFFMAKTVELKLGHAFLRI